MDKLTTYRNLVKKILSDLAAFANRSPDPEVETSCVFDEERDAYLLTSMGWSGRNRVRAMTVFVRLRNGKIWIDEDWTEEGITKDLLAAGVPKEDIVLGFQHPEMRALTDFAVA
jgi:hypothetical protein